MDDSPLEPLRSARLVVGLGNPGSEYAWTRHNVGFQVLDRLAERLGLLFRGPSKLNGWTGPRGFEWARADGDRPAFLLKPGTYMNRSGEIVAPVARWLARRGDLAALGNADVGGDPASEHDTGAGPAETEPDPASILVVFDDMDLETGQLRLRPFGGHGGQNGMRSIIDRLRTDRFPRLRVGIGRAGTDAARHVLSPFPDSEREIVLISVDEACEAIEAWLGGEDLSAVMTRFHSRWKDRGH